MFNNYNLFTNEIQMLENINKKYNIKVQYNKSIIIKYSKMNI